MKPPISRLEPEMTSRAVNSTTANVIAAPGRNIANGGIRARRLTWSRPIRWAPAMQIADTANALTVGISCCSAPARCPAAQKIPTMNPSTVATNRFSGVGSITSARPALWIPYPRTVTQPGYLPPMARIASNRASPSAGGTRPFLASEMSRASGNVWSNRSSWFRFAASTTVPDAVDGPTTCT